MTVTTKNEIVLFWESQNPNAQPPEMRTVCEIRLMRTRLQIEVHRYRSSILEGTLLAIDPASGGSSLPGFALFKAGEFVESGVIRLPQSALIATRLQVLAKTLREEFTIPDVLVIEDLPPFMSNRGGDFRTKAVVNLHYSVGVILSAIPTPRIIHCTPRSWQTWAQTHWPEYRKTDENDAIALGRCVIFHAREELENEIRHLHHERVSGHSKTSARKRSPSNRK